MTAGVLRHEVSGPQVRFLKSKVPNLAYIGGIRSGKTWAGARKARDLLLTHPGISGAICATTETQFHQIPKVIFEEALDEVGLRYIWKGHPFNEFVVAVPTKEGFVPTIVYSRTLKNYKTIRGVELGWFWFDEGRDLTKDMWDTFQGRLSDARMPNPQAFVTTTPLGFDWLYELFEEENNDDPEFEVLHAETKDNFRHIHPEFIKRRRKGFDPLMAKQELLGEYVNLSAGCLYHTFDRDLHQDDAAVWDRDRVLDFAWDFNLDPMSMVICQDYGPNVAAIDEVVLERSHVTAICDVLESRYTGQQADIVIHGGHDGHTRGATTTGKSDYMVMEQHIRRWFKHGRIKIDVPKAPPPIVDSVNALNCLMLNVDNEVHFKMHPRCKELRKDLEQVVPKTSNSVRTRVPDGKDPKRTHTSDALRYKVFRTHRIDLFDPELRKLEKMRW